MFARLKFWGSPSKQEWTKSLSIARRKEIARRLRKNRNKTSKDWKDSRTFRDVSMELGMSPLTLRREFDTMIAAHGKAEVLDVGMGQGNFAEYVKWNYGSHINVEGLTLRRPARKVLGVRVRVGWAERAPLARRKYHLIFAVGVIAYSVNPPLVLQNILNALAVGGRAYVNMFFSPLVQGYRTPALLRALEKQGIRIRPPARDLNEVAAGALLLERVSNKEVDLSRFYPKEKD